MFGRKLINIMLLIVLVASLAIGKNNASAQMPDPVDETKIPHYFGPYPNWANSPFTLQDAVVTIAPPVTVSTGNSLIDRLVATDTAANVLVVNTHTPLVNGVLTAFQTWAQAGSGPNTFNAY